MSEHFREASPCICILKGLLLLSKIPQFSRIHSCTQPPICLLTHGFKAATKLFKERKLCCPLKTAILPGDPSLLHPKLSEVCCLHHQPLGEPCPLTCIRVSPGFLYLKPKSFSWYILIALLCPSLGSLLWECMSIYFPGLKKLVAS